MEWMNISYILAFLAVFVASASQILLKQSAETEHYYQISELESDPWIWTAVRNDSSECICLSGNRAEGNTHDRGYRNHLGDSSGGEYLRRASNKENDSFYCDHSHWYHRIFVVGL